MVGYCRIYKRLMQNKVVGKIHKKNDLKCGLVTPGTHIPIVDEGKCDIESYKYALLLSWNILEFLLMKSTFIKNGGKFIVPLPFPKIVPSNILKIKSIETESLLGD